MRGHMNGENRGRGGGFGYRKKIPVSGLGRHPTAAHPQEPKSFELRNTRHWHLRFVNPTSYDSRSNFNANESGAASAVPGGLEIQRLAHTRAALS